jgi:hypothetical protein
LTPDSTQQKYAQTVVSTWIAPGCAQFLGKEKRFHTAWVKSRKAHSEHISSAVHRSADIIVAQRHVEAAGDRPAGLAAGSACGKRE